MLIYFVIISAEIGVFGSWRINQKWSMVIRNWGIVLTILPYN